MLTKGSTVLSTKEPKPGSKKPKVTGTGSTEDPAKYSDRRAHLKGRDPEPGKGKTVASSAQGGADGGDEEEDPTGANQFLEAKVKDVEQEVATQGELLSKGN